MKENEAIEVNVDGVRFLSTGKYYDGINRWVAHKIKEGDSDAIEYAAKQMGMILPKDTVLIPIPGHNGYAHETLQLARTISRNTGIPVANVLRGNRRESQYEAKQKGHPLNQEQIGFQKIAAIPTNKKPVLIDNVVDTGTTAKAAILASGSKTVLSFAMSDNLLETHKSRGIYR